jgi:chromosome segregation ATPase
MEAIATVPALSISRRSQRTFGAAIRGFLSGRSVDLEDTAFLVGVAFWVAKAAFSFFTGSFLLAIVEFCTSRFFAHLHERKKKFANLDKLTDDLGEENIKYKLSNAEHSRNNAEQARLNKELKKSNKEYRELNAELKENIGNLRTEVGRLKVERKRFAAENDRFAHNNTVYEGQIRVMKATLSRASETIARTSARASGEIEGASIRAKRILDAALASFQEKEAMMRKIGRDLKARNQAGLEQWERLATEVGEMNVEGVRALRKANEQLQRTIAKQEFLNREVSRLEEEVTRLEGIRKGLANVEARNRRTAGRLERATISMVWTGAAVAGLFALKSLFSEAARASI